MCILFFSLLDEMACVLLLGRHCILDEDLAIGVKLTKLRTSFIVLSRGGKSDCRGGLRITHSRKSP